MALTRPAHRFVLLGLVACSGAVSEQAARGPTSRGTGAGTEDGESILLALAGDVMLGRMVNDAIRARGPEHVWGDVLPLLRDADLTLGNLECVVAESGEPFHPPRVFHFRSGPGAAEALAVAGFDWVSLANNHAMDSSAEGLAETIERLDARGIAHAGAGPDLAAASAPSILRAGGITVGVVAFADHFREYGATEDAAGTNLVDVGVDETRFGRVRAAIRSARDAGADLVVFSIHWGPNLRVAPPAAFIEFAHAVVNAGADVFHGHSAHVFQGIEVYRGKPIFYDTGDLVDDYHVYPDLRNDRQLLFLVSATREGTSSIELVPLVIGAKRVNRARGDDFDEIAERIRALSEPFGTRIARRGDRLAVETGGPSR